MAKKDHSSLCTQDEVYQLCESMGFTLEDQVLADLTGYLCMVAKWNKVMNLVGRSDWRELLSTLVVDSFFLAELVARLTLPAEPQCRDLGAGAGLPGLPLRMLWKRGSYTLVEVREKRAMFLRTFLAAHPLEGVSVFHGRAETFMRDAPHSDLTVSRAFLPWEHVLAMIDSFTDPGAHCVFLTLTPLPEKLLHGWSGTEEIRYQVKNDTRYFWVLTKTEVTQ